MKELNELLYNWKEAPSIETRNAFFAKLWGIYEYHLHLWAQGFLRGLNTSKEEVYKPHDLNIDFFEKKLLKIKPSTYKEKLELYDSFDSWLWKIHKNWCITWITQRRNRRKNEGMNKLVDIPDSRQSDENLLHKDLLKVTSTILKDNPLQYKALELFLLGFSMNEIVIELDTTLDGVKGLLKRARKKLRNSKLLSKS